MSTPFKFKKGDRAVAISENHCLEDIPVIITRVGPRIITGKPEGDSKRSIQFLNDGKMFFRVGWGTYRLFHSRKEYEQER